MPPLIQVNRLTYQYRSAGSDAQPAPPALRDISLSIEEGEMIALVGANGSGKTTLARHLNALLLPTQGEVRVAGMDTRDPRDHPAIRAMVGMVFQNPEDQIVASVVEEDVAFGLQNLGMPAEEIRKRVQAALESLGMWEYRKQPPHMLSAGQVQRVALAGVLAMSPRCLLFDEATAMLDPAGKRAVMDWMHQLNRQGYTILFITHHMEEVVEAQRVLVMHKGSIVEDGSPANVFRNSPQTLANWGLEAPAAVQAARHLRRLIPHLPPDILTIEELMRAIPAYEGGSGSPTPLLPSEAPAESVIEAERLGHRYALGTPFERRSLDHVSMQVGLGSGHALLGATGSGKSTLMQHFNGLIPPQEGRLRVGKYDLNDPRLDVRQVHRFAGLVFQNPEMQFFEQLVGDEIAFGPRNYPAEEPLRERVRWAMAMVGLDFDTFKDRMTFSLSGGERRKVALASTLALKPQILLLDEPTAGLDPLSRGEILGRLRQFQQEGRTLVLSSHQMEDAAVLCDRITILQNGQVKLDGANSTVFSQARAVEDCGLALPPAAQLAGGMRKKGWHVPPSVLSLDDLGRWVDDLMRKESHP